MSDNLPSTTFQPWEQGLDLTELIHEIPNDVLANWNAPFPHNMGGAVTDRAFPRFENQISSFAPNPNGFGWRTETRIVEPPTIHERKFRHKTGKWLDYWEVLVPITDPPFDVETWAQRKAGDRKVIYATLKSIDAGLSIAKCCISPDKMCDVTEFRGTYRWSPEIETVWENFWRPLVGVANAPLSIKCELYDFHTAMREVGRAYDHLTGGRWAKINTDSSVIIDAVEDHLLHNDEGLTRALSRAREIIHRQSDAMNHDGGESVTPFSQEIVGSTI